MPVSGLIGQPHTRLATHLRISTLKTSASLTFAFQTFVLRCWILHSICWTMEVFWLLYKKYLRVGGWCVGERCGMEMSGVMFYIADVNLVPFQFTMVWTIWPCKLCIVTHYCCVPLCCVLLGDVKVTVVEFVCVWMWGQTRLLWLELLPAQSSPHIWDRIR